MKRGLERPKRVFIHNLVIGSLQTQRGESVDSQGYSRSQEVAEGRIILVIINPNSTDRYLCKLLKREKEIDDCYIINGKTKSREQVYWRR